MPSDPGEIELRKAYFRAKLAAEKQQIEVVKKVKEGKGDFLLLDTRDRASYEKEHIPGAISAPAEGLGEVIGKLPKDKELVAYCWHST